MSYILSALQKAERQRRGDPGEVPAHDWSHWRVPEVEERVPFPGWWPIAALLLVVLTVAALFWWPWTAEQGPVSGGKSPAVAETIAPAARDNNVPNTDADTGKGAGTPVAEPAPERSLAPANPEAESAGAPPTLNITGYIYFPDDPAASKLFVEGIVYRLGSSLEPGVTLREFRPHSVVLSQSGTRHEIAVP